MMLRINIPEGSTEKRARETKPIALAKNTMNRPMIERVDDFMWLFLFDLIYGQFRISPAGSTLILILPSTPSGTTFTGFILFTPHLYLGV